MLDWEENLFLGLKALHRLAFVKPDERRRALVRAELAGRREHLLFLGQLIAGRPLSILETTQAVLGRDDRLFLPPVFDSASTPEANAALYDLKVIVAALSLRDSWSPDGQPLSERLHPYQDEFPGLLNQVAGLINQLPPTCPLETLLGPPGRSQPGTSPIPSTVPDAPPPDNADEGKVTTEIRGQGQADVEVMPEKDDDGDGADLPTHTFEKVETLEEYSGESRRSDDEDELREHEEALRSLNMRRVIRSRERPHSIYRGDLILDGTGLDLANAPNAAGIPYPEWDYRERRYRPDWCRVQTNWETPSRPAWAAQAARTHRPLIQRLRRQFAALTSEWLELRRQPTGNELDLDAVVDFEVGRRSGHTPSEAIHVDRHRSLHDVATLILLDGSYSTDSWLDNHRVLDLITGTVFCVGEVLDPTIEKFAIAAFSSNTRNSCRFDLLKDFREPWGTARARLGGVQPTGYTRIGPALRHAQHLLQRQPAARKLILLITDGRPCDYDRYEGTHGIHDVRKAIETGRLEGIQTHAFAIEKHAAEHFPRMFTQHHFDIVPRPEKLAQSMCRLFARLLAH